MKIKMTITVLLDDELYANDEDTRLWLENEILIGDGSLYLHSNEIGDEVGVVKSCGNIQYQE